MSYRTGFAHGERRAFYDRRCGLQMPRPAVEPTTPQERGFWDAYLPRSLTWARQVVQNNAPLQGWLGDGRPGANTTESR